MAIGNQPPSGILMMLAEKKAMSTTSKEPTTRATSIRFQRHRRTMTKATRMVSMSMVVVTAMP